jgi:hypothetical protein
MTHGHLPGTAAERFARAHVPTIETSTLEDRRTALAK